MTPDVFIASLSPGAIAASRVSGVPAAVIVAQAALESAWGTSRLARSGHNLFGVKAGQSWKGLTLDMPTREFYAGKWVTVIAHWRKYADVGACLADHGAFLRQNPRYKLCFETTTPEDFARALQAAGYATDPRYAEKLCRIIRIHRLEQLGEA